MLQILVATIGIWLSTSYAVLNERGKAEQFIMATGDVAATNFISYRDAVVRYWTANPSATGLVVDASLTWQTGFIRDTRWTNVISGGELYVYSTAAPPPAMLQAVYQKAGNYIMVGTKNNAGTLTNAAGSVIAATLPAVIPAGALVFVGG